MIRMREKQKEEKEKGSDPNPRVSSKVRAALITPHPLAAAVLSSSFLRLLSPEYLCITVYFVVALYPLSLSF